jgi:hypothetical protein
MLLNRLEHVRPAGKEQWRAKCPAHGGDNKGTLSIALAGDDRVLLHCHAHQCPPLDILQVCGLDWQDVMPERLSHNLTPKRRKKWCVNANLRDVAEIRKIVLKSAQVIWIAGAEITSGKPLNKLDSKRLDKAMKELDTQGRVLNG